MNKRNYQKELDQVIGKEQNEERIPTLLLHSCCAPCSSYVLEYLSQYFSITVFYYNPNIYPEEEYYKRVKEQQHFIERLPVKQVACDQKHFHMLTFTDFEYSFKTGPYLLFPLFLSGASNVRVCPQMYVCDVYESHFYFPLHFLPVHFPTAVSQ